MIRLLATALALSIGAQAHANFVVQLNKSYVGDTPAGSAPWLTVGFADSGSGTVRMALKANLSDPDEFITEVWFNFEKAGFASDTLLSAKILDIPVGEVSAPSLVLADNNDGNPLREFDLKLLFQTPTVPVPGRFQNNELIVLELSSTQGPISADDFKFFNESFVGNPSIEKAYIAAKVQGIGPNADGSGRIAGDTLGGVNPDPFIVTPVPAPPALLMALTGIVGLTGAGIRRFRRV